MKTIGTVGWARTTELRIHNANVGVLTFPSRSLLWPKPWGFLDLSHPIIPCHPSSCQRVWCQIGCQTFDRIRARRTNNVFVFRHWCMCGWTPVCKSFVREAAWSPAVMCPAFGAVQRTAGPDGFREASPYQFAAIGIPVPVQVLSIRRYRPILPSRVSTLASLLHHSLAD